MYGDVCAEDLSPIEESAISDIMEALGAIAKNFHLERRSNNYLSLTGGEYGDDFCRLKIGPRSLWISLDFWGCDVGNDPRLKFVKNKNQRHWKIPLSSPLDLRRYDDLIFLSAQNTLNRTEGIQKSIE